MYKVGLKDGNGAGGHLFVRPWVRLLTLSSIDISEPRGPARP